MPARCRQRASVSPPMPAPTIATRSGCIDLQGLEDLQAARGAGASGHVLEDAGGDDLAVLAGDDLQRAGAVVEAVVARIGRGRDGRDPRVLDRPVDLLLAPLRVAVAVEEG